MSHTQKVALPAMALTALGVVFGDIGTSPLYALKEVFLTSHGLLAVTEENILGILSIIFWSLMIMVSIKYVLVIMRADNQGEGGIMALLSLNMRNQQLTPKVKATLVGIGLFGAALFFGDGIITPAISVLSAVEGLSIATDKLDPYILPIAVGILIGLFLIQRRGTGAVGKFFGPITLIWFLTLGVLGIIHIIDNPFILKMVIPYYAIEFAFHHGSIAFFIMGAVVLTITGGEALYADMGHFSRNSIRLGWFSIVLPCLTLNYAGQGALLLQNPHVLENPFFLMVPKFALYPVIGLATIATVIASQAVISGVFSIARQAMQLGYLPRMTILHTSESQEGQIYIPFLNWLLLGSVLILVFTFKSSANLAAAYGIAVTMTMMCDSLLVAAVMLSLWKYSVPKTLMIILPLLLADLTFFAASSLKLPQGGWISLLIGFIAFFVIMTWKRGRELMQEKLEQDALPLDIFIKHLGNDVQIVQGQAIFLTSTPKLVPHAMLHNLKHNKILHELNFLIHVNTQDVPFIPTQERIHIEKLSLHFIRIVVRYGFKDEMNIPQALEQACDELGLEFNMMQMSFFISRDRVISKVGDGMAPWREKLFISMQRNTSPVSDFYQIPANRVVEMGGQIEI